VPFGLGLEPAAHQQSHPGSAPRLSSASSALLHLVNLRVHEIGRARGECCLGAQVHCGLADLDGELGGKLGDEVGDLLGGLLGHVSTG
jgi:hypothetical protein